MPSAPPPPDYAEALINPIKHVSLMDQRAKQLAALIGESEVSQGRSGAGTVMHGGVCLPVLLTGRRAARLRLIWTLGVRVGECMEIHAYGGVETPSYTLVPLAEVALPLTSPHPQPSRMWTNHHPPFPNCG